MLGRLFLLFTTVTLLELYLLIQIGHWVGLGWTLVLVFGTGFAGAWLARREGWKVLRRIRDDLAARRLPTDAGLDGLLVVLAGAFLITPGVLTDTLGLALLTAPVRRPIKRYLRKRMAGWIERGSVRVVTRGPWAGPGGRGPIIDVGQGGEAGDDGVSPSGPPPS